MKSLIDFINEGTINPVNGEPGHKYLKIEFTDREPDYPGGSGYGDGQSFIIYVDLFPEDFKGNKLVDNGQVLACTVIGYDDPDCEDESYEETCDIDAEWFFDLYEFDYDKLNEYEIPYKEYKKATE